MKKSIRQPYSARYVAELDMDTCGPETVTIFEQEKTGFTGLFDARGNPLYRQFERIGFLK